MLYTTCVHLDDILEGIISRQLRNTFEYLYSREAVGCAGVCAHCASSEARGGHQLSTFMALCRIHLGQGPSYPGT